MPEAEKIVTVVSEWVHKAENDLRSAAHNLELGKNCPTDAVCFHAQQVVEKYIKAFLTLREIPFAKTHNIRKLREQLPAGVRLELSQDEMDMLTGYAAGARYPGWDDIPLAEARNAVRIARRVRREIRKGLPRKALRRK